jgi:hypothetical protein
MTNHQVWNEVVGGFRLRCPESCPSDVYEVMSACWRVTPRSRPRFKVIISVLKEILDHANQFLLESPQTPLTLNAHLIFEIESDDNRESRSSSAISQPSTIINADTHDYLDLANNTATVPPLRTPRQSRVSFAPQPSRRRSNSWSRLITVLNTRRSSNEEPVESFQ